MAHAPISALFFFSVRMTMCGEKRLVFTGERENTVRWKKTRNNLFYIPLVREQQCIQDASRKIRFPDPRNSHNSLYRSFATITNY